MWEIYCKQTGKVIWKTNSVKEAEDCVRENNNYHKYDGLTFSMR